MQSDIYRGACQRDGTKRAYCTRRVHSREGSYISPSVFTFARKNGTFSPLNRDDLGRRERRNGDLVLMENRFQLWGARVSRRR